MAQVTSVDPAAFREALQNNHDVNDLISLFTDCLCELSLKYTREPDVGGDYRFVQDSLKPLVEMLLGRAADEPNFVNIRNGMLSSVIALGIATQLNPWVVMAVTSFFKMSEAQPSIITGVVLTAQRRRDVLALKNVAIATGASARAIFTEMVKSIFGGPFFAIAQRISGERKLCLNQLTALIKVFILTQPYMCDEFSIALTGYFVECVLAVVNEGNSDEAAIPHVIRFLMLFAPMACDQWSGIARLLFGIGEKDGKHSAMALDGLMSIVAENEMDVVTVEVLKCEALKLAKYSENRRILSTVYSILSDIAPRINVSGADMANVMTHAVSMKEECGMCLLKLLPRMDNSTDFYYKVPPFDVFCPQLHLAIADKCLDETIANALFVQLLESPRLRECEPRLPQKMTDRISTYLQKEIEKPMVAHRAPGVAWFLSRFPKYEMVHEFIVRIAAMKQIPDAVSGALKYLSEPVGKMDTDKVVQFLCQVVCEQASNARQRQKNMKLMEILVHWITTLSQIPDGALLQKIMSLDFAKFPETLPSVVKALMARAMNKRVERLFVMKLMRDTVKPMHAHWAMSLMFMVVHDDRKELEKVIDQLLQSLGDDVKRNNAIHMLYYAILHEADFFRLGERFGYVQTFIVDGSELPISLHPHHSARRIYAAVAVCLNIPINSFSLVNADGIVLCIDGPLTSLTLSQRTPIIYTTLLSDQVLPNVAVAPRVMEYLAHTDRFTIMFHHMTNMTPENEVLFQFLTLFDGSGVRTSMYAPLQLVFRGEFIMSFEYADSVRVFPCLTRSAVGSQRVMPIDFAEQFLRTIAQREYGTVALATMCSDLVSTGQTFPFTIALAKVCLIDCPRQLVRETFAVLLSEDVCANVLPAILHLTSLMENRHHTKEYFQILKRTGIPPATVQVFFNELAPYETDLHSDTDETFIGMVGLLDPTHDNFTRVFQRLFATPTCYAPTPFVQTLASRKAGLEFIGRCDWFDVMYAEIQQLPLTPPKYSRVADELRCDGRNVLLGNSVIDGICQALSAIDPFVQSMISTQFESGFMQRLARIFAGVRYGVGWCNDDCEFDFGLIDVGETLAKLLNRITSEVGDSCCAPYLFGGSSAAGDFWSLNVPAASCRSLDVFPVDDIITWPRYLIVVVDREEKDTLTGPFKFPLNYTRSERYTVCSILVKGTNGIMRTITLRGSGEWRIQGSGVSERFDISDYGNLCFGDSAHSPDGTTSGAVMIVYKRIETWVNDSIAAPVIASVSRYVDQSNASMWPSIVCSTRHFLDFVVQTATPKALGDRRHRQFVFTVLTRVVVQSSEALEQWYDWFSRTLLNDPVVCSHLAGYLKTEIGDEVIALSSVSLSASVYLAKFITAVNHTGNHVVDIRVVIDWMSKSSESLQLAFVCDLMSDIAVSESGIEREPGVLFDCLTTLAKGCERCGTGCVFDRVLVVFDRLMAIVLDVMNLSGYEDVTKFIFTKEFLLQWIYAKERSENFVRVVAKGKRDHGDVIATVPGLVTSIPKVPRKQASGGIVRSSETFMTAYEATILSDNSDLRTGTLAKTELILGTPSEPILSFIESGVLSQAETPEFPYEYAWTQSLLVVIPRLLEVARETPEYCSEYCMLLEKLTFFIPTSLLIFFPEICELAVIIPLESPLSASLATIIHHLLVLDRTLTARMTLETAEHILSLRYGCSYGVQLLYLLRQNGEFPVNDSELSGACVEFCLTSGFNDTTCLLIQLLEDGLCPGAFAIPCEVRDLLSLRLANALWKSCPRSHDDLSPFIESVLSASVPREILQLSPSVREAYANIMRRR